MLYVSTRGSGGPKPFSAILLEGLAPDGGLYVPEAYPPLPPLHEMRALSYPELAYEVLSRFADDIPAEDLRRIIHATYTKEIFGSDAIVPVKELEQGLFIAGLSEGPTLAFKDIALQLLGRLFEYTLAKEGRTLNILGATSGDTGSAAEYAMRGRRGVNVFMLSPLGRMSEFQRKQMYTLDEPNIFNIAIRGTFDDCQDIVKQINEDATFKKKYKLGAVNSINWARIVAQVVYYVWAYLRVTERDGQKVSFAVPTGNFGNILAGYVAKRMGVPIEKLILATNENNVLEEFFKTGTYRPRKGNEVYATSSPSMDISKASNFERYIFDVVDRGAERMRALWGELNEKGEFTLSSDERTRLVSDGFVAGSSAHRDRLATIRSVHERYALTIDPHTADGVKVGLEHREEGMPLVCLETAQPAKFAATIREALGKEPSIPGSFAKLARLPEHVMTLSADHEDVQAYIAEKID